MRLTNTDHQQAGYAYYDWTFASNAGLRVTFDFTAWGGVTSGGIGAEGFSVFLFDGATSTFNLGPPGGALTNYHEIRNVTLDVAP